MQAAEKTTGVCCDRDTLEALSPAKPPRRLHRSRSMEDLSTEQLNTMADTTVVIFLEYVRNKTSARPARDRALMVERDRRLNSAERGEKKGSLRRLQSEPNGPTHGRRRPGDKLRTRGTADEDEEAASTELQQEPSPVGTPRPHRLLLEPPPSRAEHKRRGQYKRTLSNSSTSSADRESGHSSDATTPVPDPPLGLSPCSHDFVATYPPPSKTLHRPRSVSSPIASSPQVIAGTPVSQEYLCNGQALTPPLKNKDLALHRKHQAKLIAEKLKMYGDDLTDSQSQEDLRRLSLALEGNTNPEEVIRFFSAQLRHMLVGLSWQSIGKVFHLSYHLIELLNEILGPSADLNSGSPEWQQFSELWDFTLRAITRWIWSNGGWGAFLADTTGGVRATSENLTCPATPSFRRGSGRGRLFSLSESGEFVDEEGRPHNPDGTGSLHNGLCNGIGGKDSSVDQPQNQLEEAPLQSAHPDVPACLPATITAIPVSPPCSNCTNSGNLSPEPRRKSHSVGEQSRVAKMKREGEGEEEEGQLNRSASFPTNAILRSSARRASETAFNGIVLGVSAACVYAAVSALMKR